MEDILDKDGINRKMGGFLSHKFELLGNGNDGEKRGKGRIASIQSIALLFFESILSGSMHPVSYFISFVR